MKLTWHIVMKDLRRHQWLIAVIAAVMAAKIGIGVWVLNTGIDGLEFSEFWAMRGQGIGLVIVVLETVLSYLFVAALVHEDPLVGHAKEWRTRPISGARLLGAKALAIGLVLGALPVVIALPWWVTCGLGVGDIARSVWMTLGVQLSIALAALPLAVLTDDYRRFFLWTLVFWFGFGAVGPLAISMVGVKGSPELSQTRFLIALVLTAAIPLVVTVHQFLTLRTKRGIGLLAGGAAVILFVQNFWPWVLVELKSPAETAASKSVQLEIGETWFTSARGVTTTFQVRGVPESYRLESPRMRQVWSWRDGTEFERTGSDFRVLPRLSWMRQPKVTISGEDTQWRTDLTIPRDTAERLAKGQPALRAEASFLLSREVVEPAVRLRAGAKQRASTGTIKISRVERKDSLLWVTLVEWSRTSRNGYQPRMGMVLNPKGNGGSFSLRNTDGTRLLRGTLQAQELIGVGALELRRVTLKFNLAEPEAQAWLSEPALWQKAELLKTAYVETQTFERVATQAAIRIGEKGANEK